MLACALKGLPVLACRSLPLSLFIIVILVSILIYFLLLCAALFHDYHPIGNVTFTLDQEENVKEDIRQHLNLGTTLLVKV